jgi:hypothetical protein
MTLSLKSTTLLNKLSDKGYNRMTCLVKKKKTWFLFQGGVDDATEYESRSKGT